MSVFQKIEHLGGIRRVNNDVHDTTAEDVQRVDQQIGHGLPSDYRDFLLQYGSGSFTFHELAMFPMEQLADGQGDINAFFGAVPDESFYRADLIANYDSWVTGPERCVLHNLLPIADTGSGDLICLSLNGDAAGAVCYWEHEEIVDTVGEPGYESVYLIAPFFAKFLDLLQVFQIPDGEA